MKKKILFSLILAGLLFTIVLGFVYIRTNNNPENIVDKVAGYSNVKSKVRIILNGNEGDFDQTCDMYFSKGLGQKIEIGQDSVIVRENDKFNLIDIKTKNKFKLPEEKNNIYLLAFPNNLLQNTITKVEDVKIEGKNYIIVEVDLKDNNYNMDIATLCIDSAKKVPVEIVIKDEEGNKKGNIVYSEFDKDEKLDKTNFEEIIN